MQRFYIKSPDMQNKVIAIDDQNVVFQAWKVLRMKKGSRFAVFDERGKEFMVEALKVDNKKILGNVIEEIKNDAEPDIKIHLYQAIPKKPALFELVVQKATEIGVTAIYPLITNRTEKHRIGKFDRLLKIAIEAAEQSRRIKIPTIHHPINFEDTVGKIKNAYVAYEYEGQKMLADYLPAIRKSKTAHIFIGPEGGFDQKEIDYALSKKANLFSFGPRILRTETASIAALSIVLLN